MNKDTDTILAIQFRKEFIKDHISIDLCKECEMFLIKDENYSCLQTIPNPDNCNLLKVTNHGWGYYETSIRSWYGFSQVYY